jgi:hypothetical protein
MNERHEVGTGAVASVRATTTHSSDDLCIEMANLNRHAVRFILVRNENAISVVTVFFSLGLDVVVGLAQLVEGSN